MYKDYVPTEFFGHRGFNGPHELDMLFEFKSPYSRKLDGKVKNEYCHQIMSGLDILRFCAGGIFVQCKIVESEVLPEKGIIGRKYYYQNKLPEFCENFTRDRLDYFILEYSVSRYGKYDEDYFSLDAPIYKDGVLHDFNFAQSAKDLLGQKVDEILEWSLPANEFYSKLDEVMFENGAVAANYWYMDEMNTHLFPVRLGFCDPFTEQSKKVINSVKIACELEGHEKYRYVENIKF
jgi:hypothetical protein